MRDYELNALENYELEVVSTRKMRGAFFCCTKEAPYLLTEALGSEERIRFMQRVQSYLGEKGFCLTDHLCEDKEGRIITPLPTARYDDGRRYMVKNWFQGRECNLQKIGEVELAATNLARMHLAGTWQGDSPLFGEYQDLSEPLWQTMRRHNRELRKIYRFIVGRHYKNDFELLFLAAFPQIIHSAEVALSEAESIKSSEERNWMILSIQDETTSPSYTFIHGAYNYHNVLMTDRGVATVNFEHVHVGEPMEDLAYFLRKCMEKYSWNTREGERILEAYSQERKLSGEDWQYLCTRLSYPEKCWKIANTYYYSRKNGMVGRLEEKLQKAISAEKGKKEFLAHLSAFHLLPGRV